MIEGKDYQSFNTVFPFTSSLLYRAIAHLEHPELKKGDRSDADLLLELYAKLEII